MRRAKPTLSIFLLTVTACAVSLGFATPSQPLVQVARGIGVAAMIFMAAAMFITYRRRRGRATDD